MTAPTDTSKPQSPTRLVAFFKHLWNKLTQPKPTSFVVAKDVTLSFSGSTYSGDVMYDSDRHELTLVNHTYYEEVYWYLSTSLWPRGIVPKKGHVFIKDWDTDTGLTAALLRQGIIKIMTRHRFGFAAECMYEVQVVL